MSTFEDRTSVARPRLPDAVPELGMQQRSFSKYAVSLERCFRGLNGGRTLH